MARMQTLEFEAIIAADGSRIILRHQNKSATHPGHTMEKYHLFID
jgi:hypothetical protein